MVRYAAAGGIMIVPEIEMRARLGVDSRLSVAGLHVAP